MSETSSFSSRMPVRDYLAKHDMSKVLEQAVNECYLAQSDSPLSYLADYFLKKASPCTIDKVVGREVLDSRGNPTVEAEVHVGGVLGARASAPSGASTGMNEAKELRDGDKDRYMGKGTSKAVGHVSNEISAVLQGLDCRELAACDKAMCDKDGTELKENLGGNAITAASFALAYAGAKASNREVFVHLAEAYCKVTSSTFTDDHKYSLPTPLVNVMNGGKHAGGNLKIQEFMLVPREDISFAEKLRYVTQTYHTLKGILVEKYGVSAKNLGDEGGFAPSQVDNADEALSLLEEAITKAGFEVGKDINLALDCAASEFYDKEKKKYEIKEGEFLDCTELTAFYEKLVADHPALISIEDSHDEHDYEGWKDMTAKLGSKIQLVGDDLYTTNTRLLKQGIDEKWANALLLKVNQIGSITESMQAAHMQVQAQGNVIVSHRSGETDTTLISDLAVAIGARYIKTGGPARGERICKYNRLLQIEDYLVQQGILQQK